MREDGPAHVAAWPEAVAAWMDHVTEIGEGLLSNQMDSRVTGVKRNVEGRQTRTIARHSGSAPDYRATCEDIAASGYRELMLA